MFGDLLVAGASFMAAVLGIFLGEGRRRGAGRDLARPRCLFSLLPDHIKRALARGRLDHVLLGDRVRHLLVR